MHCQCGLLGIQKLAAIIMININNVSVCKLHVDAIILVLLKQSLLLVLKFWVQSLLILERLRGANHWERRLLITSSQGLLHNEHSDKDFRHRLPEHGLISASFPVFTKHDARNLALSDRLRSAMPAFNSALSPSPLISSQLSKGDFPSQP